MIPAAIKSARSPVVRARFTLRQTTGYEPGSAIGSETLLVRGRIYSVSGGAGNHLIVSTEAGDRWLGSSLFTPANAAARRLLAKPVPAEVRRYRRRVMRELTRARDASETNARWGALNEAIRIARKVKP